MSFLAFLFEFFNNRINDLLVIITNQDIHFEIPPLHMGTALKLYNQMGEKIYCESLRLIVAAWEGKPDSFRASVLRGVMHFVELYHGEFSEERLIRALGNVHPMEIYRVGRDNPAKLPGWKKYVFPIYMAYNGKGRKDALSMKF